MIRVVIADDQPMVRAGLRLLLDAACDIEVVAAVEDGHEAIDVARAQRVDVVCTDVRMPGLDGISATRELAGPGVVDPIAVLVLTTFDTDEYLFGAFEAGAPGFLLKDAEPDELVAAVRAVAAGNGTIGTSLTKRVLREVVTRRGLRPVVAADAADAPNVLTARELDIILLLVQGMSNDEIVDVLTLEVSTVKSHLARMMPKLGVRSRLQTAVWAYQNRIVAVPE